MRQLRKILPHISNNGLCDANYALKARDYLLKMNVIVRRSTPVTILIPHIYKEVAKF